MLLGTVTLGCPGNTITTTSNTSNGGDGGSGNQGGGTNTAGNGGTGGTCKVETEICDGLDNDCNGAVDDVPNLPMGCTCNDGTTQECYTGMEGTAGVGTCVAGTQTCANGAWGECQNQVVPADEQCNLLDDNCNGMVDDMGTASCGVGACAAVVDKCLNGQLQTCVPGQPSIEVCDGIDNNCNQLLDESDPMLDQGCNTGNPGVCSAGKMKCIMQVLTCAPDVMPTMEMCDGLDNDCDGTVDNNIAGTGGVCSTGALGVCGPGTISCHNPGGIYQIDCFADQEASTETCDGLDNDCDGSVDQGDPEGGGACNTGQLGICGPGTLHCQQGAISCIANAQAAMETCNGMDDNCDGQSDEGNPGGGQPCGCGGAGVTSCQAGAITCNGGPITYFFEDFKDNSKGWQLGPEWAIGPAVAGCQDPGQDHTPTADNGLAGVVIGGCNSTALHGYYYLTSPTINTANAAGTVYLQFWRWLSSDYDPYMHNSIEISTNNGSTWTVLPYGKTGTCCGVNDATLNAWQNHGLANPPGPINPIDSAHYPTQFDISAFKSATMKVRWGFDITSGGVFSIGQWSVDDVMVASALCP